MKRLLCIMGKMGTGGAEAFVMKLYRAIDKSKYQFDFCISDEKGFYDDEILSMGGKIIHTEKKYKHPIKAITILYRAVKNGQYKYVLRLGQHSATMVDLIIAKLAGAEVVAYRAINSALADTDLITRITHKVLFPLCIFVPDVKIAPSDLAAEFMFGKKALKKGDVLLLNNGIPLDKYLYSDKKRKLIRSELGLQDELIIGHIGRFSEQKNHRFLIDVFYKLLKVNSTAQLLLIGDGALKENIKEQVINLGISQHVHFMGTRKDVPDILSAMDVFVFPSLFEGMPNAVIEAQANGLPCVVSDSITPTVKIVDNVFMVSIHENPSFWVDTILNDCSRCSSQCNNEKMKNAGYDISSVVCDFTKAVFERGRKESYGSVKN